MKKYNNCEKFYDRAPQTNNSSEKFCRKGVQDIVIDKTEYDNLCKIFRNYVDKI